jgi:bd-type cytochrome oxidase subunit I/bd-type cytochrome oxidase subunit II
MLAVDPVPWARAQMAFTLAFHIILVPLGVSWALMALIANYRGLRHDDADALQLAQRWSKYMAVTFAVGAVTGTVLTFEFGLLWPRFMGQWGEAFGVPFAFEGIFFFTEAIFISIYIYGWRRLRPWAHFWTGVPLPIVGDYFRRRAIAAAIIAGVVTFVGIFVLHADSPYVFHGLASRGLPFVILAAVCGIASLILLVRNAQRGARALAIGAVVGVVVGWGVAQWDYLLPTSLTIADAAAPTGTLHALLAATILFVIVVIPGISLLYTLDQKNLLPGEGVD